MKLKYLLGNIIPKFESLKNHYIIYWFGYELIIKK